MDEAKKQKRLREARKRGMLKGVGWLATLLVIGGIGYWIAGPKMMGGFVIAALSVRLSGWAEERSEESKINRLEARERGLRGPQGDFHRYFN